jgi:hypothetical protein
MTPVSDEKALKPLPFKLPLKACSTVVYDADGSNVFCGWNIEITEAIVAALNRPASAVAEAAGEKGWQPIETAPRLDRILVGYLNYEGRWITHEAWWRMPYESARKKDCWWCYDGDKTLLSSDVHTGPGGKKLGATHWQPLPGAPVAPASPTSEACPECPLGPGPVCNESCEPASPAEGRCKTCDGTREVRSAVTTDGGSRVTVVDNCPDCASPPNEPEGK